MIDKIIKSAKSKVQYEKILKNAFHYQSNFLSEGPEELIAKAAESIGEYLNINSSLTRAMFSLIVEEKVFMLLYDAEMGKVFTNQEIVAYLNVLLNEKYNGYIDDFISYTAEQFSNSKSEMIVVGVQG